MNTEAMFSSKTDLWATPKDFFDQLDAEFNFTLDACALPENAKCKAYYTPEQDGLAQPWEGVVWCNPPYGRQIGQWVKKAHDAATRGGGLSLCCFLPAQIRSGSTTTYTSRRRSDSSKGGSSSATARTPHRSRVWSAFLGGA